MTETLPEGTSERHTRRRRRSRSGTIAWGLILIALGGWFLLSNLGFNLPSMAQMWPLFVLVPGILFLAGYIFGEDHDPGLAFVGSAATLLGVFFFMTTLGIGGLETSDMGRLWPVYPLIGGVAFLVQWVAGGFRDWGLLIPAAVALLVGLVGLSAVVVGEQATFLTLLAKGWPVILIIIGLSLLVGYLVEQNRR